MIAWYNTAFLILSICKTRSAVYRRWGPRGTNGVSVTEFIKGDPGQLTYRIVAISSTLSFKISTNMLVWWVTEFGFWASPSSLVSSSLLCLTIISSSSSWFLLSSDLSSSRPPFWSAFFCFKIQFWMYRFKTTKLSDLDDFEPSEIGATAKLANLLTLSRRLITLKRSLNSNKSWIILRAFRLCSYEYWGPK